MQRRSYYRGPQPVCMLSPIILQPLLKQKGYYLATLIMEWPNIVGEVLASQCQPRKLYFQKAEKGNGQLHLSATTGFSMEIGYQSLIITEKVNTYIGFTLVGKITTDSKLIATNIPDKKTSAYFSPANGLEEALTRLHQCIKTEV